MGGGAGAAVDGDGGVCGRHGAGGAGELGGGECGGGESGEGGAGCAYWGLRGGTMGKGMTEQG